MEFFKNLRHANLYKKTQGKIARQITFFALAIVFVIAAWRVSQDPLVSGLFTGAEYALGGGILILGLWFCFRLINLSQFADFLIAVEAEMNKVSWPTKQELIRSSIVVIFIIFFMAALLYGFDILWEQLFRLLYIKS
ncbi:MAG: preprotein translocase subunit SecE [Planctomycetota bacterium]|nr:preprotein translocase subunit SecE [Planctomycetota bacterium]